MKNLIHYTFNILYKIRRSNRIDKDHAFRSSLILGLIMMLYLFMILEVIDIRILMSNWALGICCIIILISTVVYFFYNKRYIQIIEDFSDIKINQSFKLISIVFIIWGFVGYPIILLVKLLIIQA